MTCLSEVLGKGDAQGFADLFLEYGVWRDKLSFTWDYRTFNFKPAIIKAATDLLPFFSSAFFLVRQGDMSPRSPFYLGLGDFSRTVVRSKMQKMKVRL